MRALYLALLSICSSDSEGTLLSFKELAYGCSIPTEKYSSFLQRHNLQLLGRANILKKLLAEFLQLLGNTNETAVDLVRRIPILDMVMVLVLRAILGATMRTQRLGDVAQRVDLKAATKEFAGMLGLRHTEVCARVYTLNHVLIREEGEFITIHPIDRPLPKPTADPPCLTQHSPSKSHPVFQRKLSIENSARIVYSE